MDRNGALTAEEWRPRRLPLWVHSTNLLNRSALAVVPTPLKTLPANLYRGVFHMLCTPLIEMNVVPQ